MCFLAFTVIHPLLHAKKFILVGDPAQLPPVVQNTAARRLGTRKLLLVQNTATRQGELGSCFVVCNCAARWLNHVIPSQDWPSPYFVIGM